MIIKIALCLIAALIVLANYKALRNTKIFAFALVLAAGLLGLGIYMILRTEGARTFYAAFMTPFSALILLAVTRSWYKRKFGTEIILYMRGFYPVRYEERFVTRLEKTLTFVITLLSVALPIAILEIF